MSEISVKDWSKGSGRAKAQGLRRNRARTMGERCILGTVTMGYKGKGVVSFWELL